jgi:ABC-type lipoprotein release transport system permease subunit
VAAATFSSGLHRLEETPARYGWTADFSITDAKPIDLPNVALDPRVVDLDWVGQSSVRLDGSFVTAFATTSIKGDLDWTLLEGRKARAADEVAVGPGIARRLGVHVGDTTTVPDAKGQPHRLRVVGIVLTPVDSTQALGESLLLTAPGLLAVQQSPPITSMLVRTHPGAADSLRRTLARRFEVVAAAPPSEVRQVSDLGRLPDALALFLAAVGAAALAHGLVLTSRRRAHDIAVLRALGFTPRQVGLSVVTMSGVTAVIGLVLGIPLGLAVGRVVWHQVAESTRVAADVAVPIPVLLGIWPAVLLAAAALALLPARRSAAVRPAGVLRSE